LAERDPPNKTTEGAGWESGPLGRLSREELRRLYKLAYGLALSITKSKQRAEVTTQIAFERLLTTRQWDGRATIELHVIGIVKSLLSIEHASKKEKHDEEAHEGFHQEVVGHATPSTEQSMLEHDADDSRQRGAKDELVALRERVVKHPLAPRVLDKRIEGMTKAADIAAALDVSVDDVYRANDVLHRALQALRGKKE
jgi:DNA-directed RNA polymerase specialized sigma24 family protein